MNINEYLSTNESQKTYSEAKLKIWETNFKNLAKNFTGNSKTTEKWESLLNFDIQIFPECDASIKWYDITIVLKNIPNNKSPGIDGIPNEVWKSVSNEASPTSSLAKVIFRILKFIWDTAQIPEIMTTSIVVPILKKGNLQDPNNYR
ncbi:hypothetical protein AYI68_g7460, partial [Smittium mucronatum]